MLKKKQYEAIQLLVYTEMKPGEIEEELGISHSTFWRWQYKNEEFMDELEKENRKKFRSLQTKALQTMAKLMEQGHFQAAKYLLDGNNYAPDNKPELDLSLNISVDYGEDDEG